MPRAPLASPIAPTSAVSPETATEYPNWSPASVFEALRYACWLQFVPLRVKTYAAPAWVALMLLPSPLTPVALLFSWQAPTTTVSAEAPTAQPKFWYAAVLEDLR